MARNARDPIGDSFPCAMLIRCGNQLNRFRAAIPGRA
jgi:hypothetical protein